ncbi:hypothetical protein M407DRAFT_10695 [Tulasnella calospora MUT 4182]|uniref:Uncharacterized protein n=1 Tax=Tulasnella calospora MUT 4182 TaxID=1051891 RepID=A0A0C3PZE5_9AGAM|nr:hypothetical protein M407DRAFT_10695 [Tulasnella calospora MUT 4182]
MGFSEIDCLEAAAGSFREVPGWQGDDSFLNNESPSPPYPKVLLSPHCLCSSSPPAGNPLSTVDQQRKPDYLHFVDLMDRMERETGQVHRRVRRATMDEELGTAHENPPLPAYHSPYRLRGRIVFFEEFGPIDGDPEAQLEAADVPLPD